MKYDFQYCIDKYYIDCQDVRDDCQNHLHACAGVFKTWAIKNCVRSCGYCLSNFKNLFALSIIYLKINFLKKKKPGLFTVQFKCTQILPHVRILQIVFICQPTFVPIQCYRTLQKRLAENSVNFVSNVLPFLTYNKK